MKLIERFVEFNTWSTSRKTALLTGLALPFHGIIGLLSMLFFLQAGTVDRALYRDVLLGGGLALLLPFVASLALAGARREGRWTAYLLILLYGAFIGALAHILGTWSTPVIAVWPLTVILVAAWFDNVIGWVAFGYGVVVAAFMRVAEGSGLLPYAPALLQRSIDAQQSGWWIAATILLVGMFFVFCFVLSMMIAAARRLQDQRLREAHAQLGRVNTLIRRYVPSQLADEILRGEHREALRPERLKLTVFFSDVEGFTDSSDRLDPEELTGLLNEYLSEMAEIAERYGATINQFVGDGIMIFFGAPQATSDKDHALRAVRMALEMQRHLLDLTDKWRERGIERPFRARIGINTGYASVGDFGSPGRKMYSAIGVQTNLAARIQAHCPPGRILVSHTTWALVHDQIPCVAKGEFQLKGVHYPVQLYEVAESGVTSAVGNVVQWPLPPPDSDARSAGSRPG